MTRWNHLSNRKKRTELVRPGALRLVFFGQPFFYQACSLWRAHAFTNARMTYFGNTTIDD